MLASAVISACAGSVGPDVDYSNPQDGGAARPGKTNRPEASNASDAQDDVDDDVGQDDSNTDDSEPSASDNPDVSPTTGSQGSTNEGTDEVNTPDETLSERATFPVHRMTAAEYNNTVSALFGTPLTPADAFPAAGTSEFDANVGVLASLSQVSVQGYLNAARDLAQTAFTDAELRERIVMCDPAQGDELGCVRQIATAFGLRAFRRPLEAAEVERYVGAYTNARETLSLAHTDALQQMIRTLLSAPSFFMRVELPKGQLGDVPTERLAVASRLSYLLWTTMPDDELLAKAIDGGLSSSEEIAAEVERMLSDPQSVGFYRDFFGQWLGIRALHSHNPDTAVFPNWDASVRAAMLTQAYAYFGSFVDGSNEFSTFLTAPHPDNDTLQEFYDSEPEGVRAGFLTLPAFLTASSLSDRTSPTSRATAVLGGLLCTNIAPPANVDIPDLSAQEGASVGDNIRDRLAQHRESPDCATCHEVLDPIGLSMENFDAVGGYRTTYGNGTEVDASGEFAGVTFDDNKGLVTALSGEARLGTCPPTKLLTYALRRSLTKADKEVAATLASQWNRGNITELVKLVTTSPTFMSVLNAPKEQP